MKTIPAGPQGLFKIGGALTLLCGAASLGLALAALRWGAVFTGVLGRGQSTVKLHLLVLLASGVTLLPLGVMTLTARPRAAVLSAVVEIGYAAWLFASTRHGLTIALGVALLAAGLACLLAAARAPTGARSEQSQREP